MPVADENAKSEHQQQKRIKPREPGPEERGCFANRPAASHRSGVIVMNDKAAQDEEQRHPEPGRLFNPINVVIAHQHGNAVRDQHTERRDETQTRQGGHGVAMNEARHGAEFLPWFPALLTIVHAAVEWDTDTPFRELVRPGVKSVCAILPGRVAAARMKRAPGP